jgi:protease-4
MSSWPPNPDSPQHTPPSSQPTTKEWFLLEKTLLASIEEQRRARRWNIFFKGLSFFFLLLFFLVVGKSCSNGDGNIAASAAPHLAVVDITGEIAEGKSANSDDIITALNSAFDASQSKAVVLNINSPGGSPVESDLIWKEVRRLRVLHPAKKVYAVIGDMGASGAYYIASSADEIYVNPCQTMA